MLNIILFGPPGSGKGTQAEKLVQKYGLVHVSTGDLLRSEIANKTALGLEAKNFMDQGLLVPDEVVIGMIDNKLGENKDSKGLILDGFPRTVAQAEALNGVLTNHNTSISAVLALNVTDTELKDRLLKRGATSGRPDNADPKVIEKRINVYKDQTAVVGDFYTKEDKFVEIAGEGSIEEIFSRLTAQIEAVTA